MAFYIKRFPGQRFMDGYADNRDFAAYFGYGKIVEYKQRILGKDETWQTIAAKKYPADAEGEVMVEVKGKDRPTKLILRKSPPTIYNHRGQKVKSSKHRVYAICPDCQVEVPAGRAHQHMCKSS